MSCVLQIRGVHSGIINHWHDAGRKPCRRHVARQQPVARRIDDVCFPNADCTSGYAKPRPPQPNSLASGCKTVACGTRAQCAWTWSVHDRCRVLPMRRHTSWRAIAVQCFQLRNRASTTAPSAFRNGASPATRYASGTRLEPVVASAWRRDHQAHAKCNDRAPCKARPNEATRCPHGWPCPARTPCALHPIAHCSLSITIEQPAAPRSLSCLGHVRP